MIAGGLKDRFFAAERKAQSYRSGWKDYRLNYEQNISKEGKEMKKVLCRRIFTIILVGVFLIVGLTGIAFATYFQVGFDGVFLIRQPFNNNQFPIKITNPGSYKLVGNITVPNANTTAILIQANNVTIDLNGFSIIGPTVCSGTPTVCSSTGSGMGIDAINNNPMNTKIINGSIQGMGQNGIGIFVGSVDGVHAYSNGALGIGVYIGMVNNSMSLVNGLSGIEVNNGTVSGNTSGSNGADGIRAAASGIVSNNNIFSNKGFGLAIGPGVGYVNNNLMSNAGGNVSAGTSLGSNICNGALCL
jgi:hypothetical protein